MAYIDYTDPAQSLERWITEIAPKYFDFDTSELNRAGMFGYVNEVMSTVTMDGSRAMSNARREFYPTTATWAKSFYKMGALHKLSYPLANASHASAVILLKESEIITHAEVSNSIYKFVIDDTLKVLAGEVEFMLDFPIIILAKKKKVGASILSNPTDSSSTTSKYAYTVRYDNTYTNSLNTQNIKYIKSKTTVYAGETYLLIKVGLRQVTKTILSSTINSSPTLTNVTIDFPISGQLCNFEIFYRESSDSTKYQLTKLPINSQPINGKFCMYSLVNDTTLRISFPMNAYFTPKFNSTLEVHVYTTLGSAGNYPIFNMDLVCSSQSETYPYNNMVAMLGQIKGSSEGGVDLPTLSDFKQSVISAYATNKVYVTDTDLQIYFDDTMLTNRNKVLFFKRRDDVFERLYGSFMLIKDSNGNVIPTNTLTMELTTDDLNAVYEMSNKAFIKPGRVWKYQDAEHFTSSLYNVYPTDLSLNTDINDSITDFCFVNPFLIHVSMANNAIGYYLNTMDDTLAMDTVSINDSSYVQFNLNSFNIHRNAIRNEDFYKLTVYLSPSVSSSGLETLLITQPEDLCEIDSWPAEIRAEYDGIIEGYVFINVSVFLVIKYTPSASFGVTNSMLTKYVEEVGMNLNENDLRIYVRVSSNISPYTTSSGQLLFNTASWYTTELQPGDTFTAGSIIANRKLQDTGILRVIAELPGDTDTLFLPFLIESYDSTTDIYTMSTYISTMDAINDEGRLEIIHGFYNQDGTRHPYVSIDPTDCTLTVSSFVQYDDINTAHSYSDNVYVKNHTFTNTYQNQDSDFSFIKPIKFIRSTLSYNQTSSQIGTSNYYLRINEVPMVRANWLKTWNNINDLIKIINSNYEFILQIYNLLENNFSVDLKFFNTYGKSKFYRIGVGSAMNTLDKVNIVPKFGIKINALASYDEFKSRFINYIREYIESFNDVSNTGKSLHVMELVTSISNNFDEIERLEYYGIDNYTAATAQNIEALSKDEISALGYNKYVPEFINVYCEIQDSELIPQIEITTLE